MQVERIYTAGLTINQILEQVQNKAEEMDTMQVGMAWEARITGKCLSVGGDAWVEAGLGRLVYI